MIAVALIAVFLLVSWIMLIIPFSNNESTELVLCLVTGLSAVVIVASSIIIGKLNSIHKLLKENKENKEKPSEKEENN